MTEPQHYDAIVIGAGQSGGPLATAAGEHGWKTALVERAHLGGTCVNVGCTPTKAMIGSAAVAHLARRAGEYGVNAGDVAVDMRAIRQRKRAMVEQFREGNIKSMDSAENVDLIYGEARFTGEKAIEVQLNDGGVQSLTADRFFIDTGTRNAAPPIEGLDSTPYLDSTAIMELDELPERLIVIGGGYIGLEFAQMFRHYGSDVTVLQRGNALLSGEDGDIADAVLEILREDGVRVHLCSDITRASSDSTGRVTVEGQVDGQHIQVSGTHLLIAVGRTPNTDALRPDLTGVELDDAGYIKVNERLETNVPGIWAMGEVAGQPAFTHISYDDFRILRANLLDGGDRTTSDRLLSYVMYTNPQLGRVGMSEQEAREAGKQVRIARMPMVRVARARQTGQTRGVMKAVVDAETDQILGAAILGSEGGELMSIIQTAMLGKLPYQVLRDAPYSHPTLAESLNNLFNSFQTD